MILLECQTNILDSIRIFLTEESERILGLEAKWKGKATATSVFIKRKTDFSGQ